MSRTIKWGLITLLVLVAAVGLPYLGYNLQESWDASERTACNGRMCGIGTAMHHYHEATNHLPPAYLTGPDGKPWHSWRILLLPYIGENDFYTRYNFDEPWDGPNNRQLMARPTPNAYACTSDPKGKAAGRTNYFVVVGPGTAFPPTGPDSPRLNVDIGSRVPGEPSRTFSTRAKWVSFPVITRPPGETILALEAVGQDIHWMEPRDLSFADMSFTLNDSKSPSVSSHHKYPTVVFADGSRRGLNGVSPLDLRAMLLIGPEPR